MSDLISDLVSVVYKSKSILPRFKIAATGGGTLLQSIFALAPGISSSLVENIYPYSESETVSYLGFRPEGLASEECALEMAMKAYQDAAEYGKNAFGIGVSCALATERELKGGERAFLAIFGEDEKGKSIACIMYFKFSIAEIKSVLNRRQAEERAIAEIGIYFLLHWLKTKEFSKDIVVTGEVDFKILSSAELQSQIIKHPYFSSGGDRKEITPESEKEPILFPCTANPPHEAHFEMAYKIEHTEIVSADNKAIFNLTFDPPHKELVEPHEMLLRAKMINKKGYDCLLSVGDGLFLEKIKRNKMHLMMGYDAFINFLNKKFYALNQEVNFCDFLTKNGFTLMFYIFDRFSEKENELKSVAKLQLLAELNQWPENLLPLDNKMQEFIEFNVIRVKFSNQLSSTKIRESLNQNGN